MKKKQKTKIVINHAGKRDVLATLCGLHEAARSCFFFPEAAVPSTLSTCSANLVRAYDRSNLCAASFGPLNVNEVMTLTTLGCG